MTGHRLLVVLADVGAIALVAIAAALGWALVVNRQLTQAEHLPQP